MRIGFGYDSHRFGADRPLRLAGVPVPHPTGLVGHSDGDAIAHAVTDALLGAAALGDIGALFPDGDPAWKDADSMGLLREAYGRVREAGFHVENLDVTVICEAPRIRPHADAMRASLAAALGLEPSAVSIKGKTNEGLDALGRGEGLAVHAVALLTRS